MPAAGGKETSGNGGSRHVHKLRIDEETACLVVVDQRTRFRSFLYSLIRPSYSFIVYFVPSVLSLNTFASQFTYRLQYHIFSPRARVSYVVGYLLLAIVSHSFRAKTKFFDFCSDGASIILKSLLEEERIRIKIFIDPLLFFFLFFFFNFGSFGN